MEDNKFLDLVSSPLLNLDHTYRYSGTKLVEPESLSQHIVDTIMMGIKIVDKINTISENFLDPTVYVMKASYHDLEEVITGDIPRPLKYHDEVTLQSMRDVANEVAESLFKAEFHRTWESHYSLWETAKDGREGFILKIVDNLVVVNKVLKEVSLLHNYYMLRVAHEVLTYTGELHDHLKEYLNDWDEEIVSYLEDLLHGAIQSMQDILREHDDKLNLCRQSMIGSI